MLAYEYLPKIDFSLMFLSKSSMLFFRRFDERAEGRFSLPLAFFIEVAISQIFPLGLSLPKIKKLCELRFYLEYFTEIFGIGKVKSNCQIYHGLANKAFFCFLKFSLSLPAL